MTPSPGGSPLALVSEQSKSSKHIEHIGTIRKSAKTNHFSCKNHGLEVNISPSMKIFRFYDVTGPNTRGTLSTENRKLLGVIIFEGNYLNT